MEGVVACLPGGAGFGGEVIEVNADGSGGV